MESFSGGEFGSLSNSEKLVSCPFSGFSEMEDLLPTAGSFAVFRSTEPSLHCRVVWRQDCGSGLHSLLWQLHGCGGREFSETLGFEPPSWVVSTDQASLDQPGLLTTIDRAIHWQIESMFVGWSEALGHLYILQGHEIGCYPGVTLVTH